MEMTVQVSKGGAIPLPNDLRRRFGIQTGDSLRMVDWNGVPILTPATPNVSDLAPEIEQARLNAGLPTEELFDWLRKLRTVLC